MALRIFFFAFIALLAGCASAPTTDANGNPIVHIDRLLWEPAKYDGQTVTTRGYMMPGGVDRGLYATYCSTVDPASTRRALYFKEQPPQLQKVLRGTEVDLTGRIDASDKGHLGVFAASIAVEDVRYVRTIFMDDDRCGK